MVVNGQPWAAMRGMMSRLTTAPQAIRAAYSLVVRDVDDLANPPNRLVAQRSDTSARRTRIRADHLLLTVTCQGIDSPDFAHLGRKSGLAVRGWKEISALLRSSLRIGPCFAGYRA